MLLDRLRTETSFQHQSLEALLPLPATRAEYVHRLMRFLGFVEPWEERLRLALADYPHLFEGRMKAELLRRDLGALGVIADGLSEGTAPIPTFDSAAAALGSMYVMEGSTLGGQYIVREVQTTLGLEANCLTYFGSYGRDVGRRWQEFRQSLLEFSSPTHDDLILGSAQQTFAALEAWFSPSLIARVG